MKNLIGQKFNKLFVKCRTNRPTKVKDKRIYYLCICDCGNEAIVSSTSLVSGHTKSCGCLKHETPNSFIDLTGKVFGKLCVIKRVENKGNQTYWLCKCDCGNEKIIYGGSLIRGYTKSCGCLVSETFKKKYGESSLNKIYYTYVNGAEKRNLSFSLTKEEFEKILKTNCYYCGISPSNIQKNMFNNGDYIYNGIDRINSSKGYETDNVVACCWKCNRAKSIMSYEEFIELVKLIYNNLQLDDTSKI
jgi:hypothetical protein